MQVVLARRFVPWILATQIWLSREAAAGQLFSQHRLSWAMPSTSGGVLLGVAAGPDRWVAVGTGGTILVSEDAAAWREVQSGTTHHLRSVTFGNGSFVGTGDHGTVLGSADGLTWTPLSIPTTQTVHRVDYGNGYYIAAVGDPPARSAVFRSTDLRSWEEVETPLDQMMDIAFGQGHFVGLAFKQNPPVLLVSTDGAQWTDTQPPNISGQGIQFAGDRWFLHQSPYSSLDPVHWDLSANLPYYHSQSIAYGAGIYVMFRQVGTTVHLSDEGIYWRPGPDLGRINGGYSGGEDLVFARGQFVAVGGEGGILTSPDGQQWVQRRESDWPVFEDFASSPTRLLAAGWSVVDSPVGVVFERGSAGWTQALREANASFFGVATDGVSAAVAVGASGRIRFSPRSGEWRAVPAPHSSDYLHVAHGSGRFVAATRDGDLAYSENGDTWHSAAVKAEGKVTAMEFLNGRFVALTEAGAVYASTDGSSWTRQGDIGPQSPRAIAYGNGRYLVGATQSRAYSSDDLKTWRETVVREPVVGELASWENAFFAEGEFVLCSDFGAAVSSAEGTDWTVEPTRLESVGIRAAGFEQGRLLLGGNYYLLESLASVGPRLAVSRDTDGMLTLRWPDAPGYRLRVALNLGLASDWSDYRDSVATEAGTRVTRVSPVDSRQFFRLDPDVPGP